MTAYLSPRQEFDKLPDKGEWVGIVRQGYLRPSAIIFRCPTCESLFKATVDVRQGEVTLPFRCKCSNNLEVTFDRFDFPQIGGSYLFQAFDALGQHHRTVTYNGPLQGWSLGPDIIDDAPVPPFQNTMALSQIQWEHMMGDDARVPPPGNWIGMNANDL